MTASRTSFPATTCRWSGLAVLVLWFGWFGFNAGSTLGAIGGRFADVVVVTQLAAAAGVLGAMLMSYLKMGKFDMGMTANGAIAALVAITAPSGYVEFWAAPTDRLRRLA